MRCSLFILLLFIPAAIFSQPYVIAHRGASAYKPENSLSAFEEAIRMKADYIETDVHQTKDGEVVIMHDFSVKRTCGNYKKGKDEIRDMTSDEFGRLLLKGTNEAPPTLDLAIKVINGRCKMLIEIKKGSDYYPDIEEHILEVIRINHAEGWVDIIHSFDKEALLNLQKQKTGINLQKLIVFKFPLASFTFSKKTEKDNFASWQGVNAFGFFTNERLVRKIHSQGKTIFVWTINKEKKMRKLFGRGVDGIITNKPDLARKILLEQKANLTAKKSLACD